MKNILIVVPLFFCQVSIAAENMEEVVVREAPTRNLTEVSIETEKLLNVPGAMGDPLAAVFSLPGVLVSDGEPAVRGSSPEDNSYLVDFLPAGNVYHAFGFSIFSKNLLADFTLLPASYPAEYGGATGAVFDITTRDPKSQPWEFTIEGTFIRAGFAAEGEIKPGHNAYFSYRRSLLNLFIEEGEEDEDDPGFIIAEVPVLQDYQGKYTWDIATDNKLTLALLGSSDNFKADITADSPEALLDPDVVGRQTLDSRFDRQSVTWDRVYDNNAALKVAVGFYQDELQVALGGGQFLNIESDDVILRGKYDFDINANHRITLGGTVGQNKASYAYDVKISPCTDFDPDCDPDITERNQDSDSIQTQYSEIFAQDEWRLHETLLMTLGFNASNDDYLKEDLVEPRVAFEWRKQPERYIKLATGEYHRTPDDEQIIRDIGNPELRNIKARHYTLSYGEDNKKHWDWSADVYYKELYDLAIADEVLNYSNNAEGEAYGVELFVEKNQTNNDDKWYGWVSLSWSRSERTDLNTSRTTVFVGDTPVVLNMVYNYEITPRWDLGFNLSYRTGAAYTEIVGIEPNPNYPGLFRPVYGELNAERLPSYQRIDLRSEYDFKIAGNDAKFIFEILNVLNHDNIQSIDYEPTPNDSVNNFNLVAEKGIEAFPSIGFQVTF